MELNLSPEHLLGVQTFSSPPCKRKNNKPNMKRGRCQVPVTESQSPPCPPPWQSPDVERSTWKEELRVWVAAPGTSPGRSSPSVSHGSHLLVPACPHPFLQCPDMHPCLPKAPAEFSLPVSQPSTTPASSTPSRAAEDMGRAMLLCPSHGMALPLASSGSPAFARGCWGQENMTQGETPESREFLFYFIYSFF